MYRTNLSRIVPKKVCWDVMLDPVCFCKLYLNLVVKWSCNFSCSWLILVIGIDYRFEDGHSSVTISNPDSLFSSKAGDSLWIRSGERHLSDWARCQKAIDGIYFTKKWRAETLQPGLEFDNFKPRLKSGIFKCISWLNGSFFVDDDRGPLKEEVKTGLMARMLTFFNSPNLNLS
jgi:hypothetical protein